MNYNEFIQLLEKRRTIHKFTTQHVTKNEVYKIIEAGRLAPSGFNSQPWECVVVQDEDLRTQVVRTIQAGLQDKAPDKIAPNMNVSFATAPTFIILYGDPKVRGFGLPHLQADEKAWEFVLNTSLAVAYQQMHIAAASLDLGTMWVSAIRKPGVDEKIREILGIPKDLVLFELMAVGHPNEETKPKRLRELDEMIHWNKSDDTDYRTYEDVKEWFEQK